MAKQLHQAVGVDVEMGQVTTLVGNASRDQDSMYESWKACYKACLDNGIISDEGGT